jgi:uncharacterized protein YutE (UPF0331/DUF86 family)
MCERFLPEELESIAKAICAKYGTRQAVTYEQILAILEEEIYVSPGAHGEADRNGLEDAAKAILKAITEGK